MRKLLRLSVACLAAALLTGGCASRPQATSAMVVESAAGAPYRNVLVIALFESFDARRYLEKEILKKFAEEGVEATAMTSMTDTRTIINRDTVLDRVAQSGADGVLVVQLASFESRGEVKDANPQATYNVWPTYWYNVWAVELTEYVEPTYMQFTDELALTSAMYSAETQERVWWVNTDWTIKEQLEPGTDYSVFIEEAEAIVDAARRDRLIAE